MAAHSTHPFGEPVNILKFGEERNVLVDKEKLGKILLHDEVKNRKVVVLTIVGAFRRGKSFFLDYCLRYLYANYPSVHNPSNATPDNKNWMGSPEEPLKGFTWKSGTDRDTSGIIMWSDVFLHTVETTGEKVAIVIIDTQGLFDNQTSPAENSRIFALGTLISSIELLNINGIVQEDQLEYLQFATEFAKFVALDSNGTAGKPFQTLMFLIRDWNNPDEFEFGTEGGEEYLRKILTIKPEQKEQLKSVRRFIATSFDQLQCCLLPHPGKKVATAKSYDGRWKLMDEDFKDELASLIRKLLSPENLVLKKINGNDLTASELVMFIETYFDLFQSEGLPQAQSIVESTVDKQMDILISKCLDSYKENIVRNQDLLDESNLHIFHDLSKNKTLLMFKDEKKMASAENQPKYKQSLLKQMDKLYTEWKDRSLKSLEQIKAEKRKTEKAILEKTKLEKEAEEAARLTKEKQIELERQKEMQLIESQKYEAEKKVVDMRLEAEKERAKKVEAERDSQKAWREVLEQKLANEKLQNELAESRRKEGKCTIL